ncbi:hypothetical protein EBU71_20830 [bacterium]|nr:hypothetical protein [Candidatus Elulimicrobium humile]
MDRRRKSLPIVYQDEDVIVNADIEQLVDRPFLPQLDDIQLSSPIFLVEDYFRDYIQEYEQEFIKLMMDKMVELVSFKKMLNGGELYGYRSLGNFDPRNDILDPEIRKIQRLLRGKETKIDNLLSTRNEIYNDLFKSGWLYEPRYNW